MDYSLLVGVDSVKNELVMGIVGMCHSVPFQTWTNWSTDYIRTYTWDKKLESWVKDASFLGGGAHKGEPTIVTPKQYKARFRSAMERYFPLVRHLHHPHAFMVLILKPLLQVPDRWMKQEDQHDEEGGGMHDPRPDC